jgi:hypothetical protein
MMWLPAHGDQQIDPRGLARDHVRRAEISGIRQQPAHFAQFARQRADPVRHRFDLPLVVGRLNHIRGDQQQAVRRHRRLCTATLLKVAAGNWHDARVFFGQIDLIPGERPLGRRRGWFAAGFLSVTAVFARRAASFAS